MASELASTQCLPPESLISDSGDFGTLLTSNSFISHSEQADAVILIEFFLLLLNQCCLLESTYVNNTI